MHTAITCLVLAARRHGVHTTVERVVHDYALKDEPDTRGGGRRYR